MKFNEIRKKFHEYRSVCSKVVIYTDMMVL